LLHLIALFQYLVFDLIYFNISATLEFEDYLLMIMTFQDPEFSNCYQVQ